LQEHGIHGDREIEPGAPVISSRRTQTIPLARIRPGRYQKRETLNPTEYEQLKKQIEELGLAFTAVLMPDPDDSEFFNLAMGGHIRVQAAQDAGLTEVQGIIREYDQLSLAKGTYMENNGRQPLSLVEEGKVFLQCQQDFGWSQEQVADNLIVPGGRSHVALCLLTVTCAPDLQEMLRKAGKRGQRAFFYFRQLDEHFPAERAIELRAPHIQGFLEEKISTDEVRFIIRQIIEQEGAEPSPEALEAAKREQKVHSTVSSFARYQKQIAGQKPGPIERESLLTLRQQIDEILARE
jgi:ParB/RepB/Spo0J family partition protein